MPKKLKAPPRSKLSFDGGLITFNGNQCLGDLMHFEGYGTYDPTLGRVDVTKEEALEHNRALDTAWLQAMDTTCEIGQGDFAYLGTGRVCTFSGRLISDQVRLIGRDVEFRRGNRVFRGRQTKNGPFNFKRIA